MMMTDYIDYEDYKNTTGPYKDSAIRENYRGIKVTYEDMKNHYVGFKYEVYLDWEDIDHGSTINIEMPDIKVETGSPEEIVVREG